MGRVWAIQWHITTKCDQRCRHCYIFNSLEGKKEIKGEKKITWPVLQKIADNIKITADSFGAKCKVAITGGDPLLHPHFFDLIKYLRKLGVGVSVMGSPWTINNDVVKELVKVGVTTFQLSMDGMKKVHDSWRKNGSFDRTIDAIRIFQNNSVDVAVMTTVSKKNANDVPDVIRLVSDELKISVHAFARYVPTHSDTRDNFSPQEYRQFLHRIWPYYAERVDGQTSFHLKDHLWKLYLHEEGLFKPEDTNGVVVGGCGIGIGHISILADGTVYACRRFNSPLGSAEQENLSDLFFGNKMEAYRDINALEKCKDCFLRYYCRGCMAVAYGSTGDWRKPDPQCWL